MSLLCTFALIALFQPAQLTQHFPGFQSARAEVVAEHTAQRQAQAGQVIGIGLLVSRERQ